MNLREARYLVREYLLETKAAQFDDLTLDSLIAEANNQVWAEILSVMDDRIGEEHVFSYPVDAPSIDFASTTTVAGASVPSWLYITSIMKSDKSSVSANDPLTVVEASPDYDSLFDVQSYEQSKYFLSGSKMHIWPIPDTTTYIHVQLVPPVSKPVADTDILLNNIQCLVMFHEIVVLLATIRARTMTEDPIEGFAQIYKIRRQSMQDCLTSSQQRHSSIRVINKHR